MSTAILPGVAGNRVCTGSPESKASSPVPALDKYQTLLTPAQKLYFQSEYDKLARSPSTALLLCLLLGGFGAHRFYLRQIGWGVAYILFAWTFVPLVVALVECFTIQKRTRIYDEDLQQDILRKMDIIFSERAATKA